MKHTTDDSEYDPNAHDDRPAIITVDWAAVEDDIGHEIEPEFRRRIEHTGSINERLFDKWGYNEFPSSLVDAVREHGRLLHPDCGALDARHAPLSNMGGAIGTLRNLRGDDYYLETIIEDGDDAIFVAGFADLYDAACALDECRDDWPDDHPKIAFGDYQSDRLGDHYVAVMHPDREVIENIDVTDLPIEPYTFDDGEQFAYYHIDDYYYAEFRHERY